MNSINILRIYGYPNCILKKLLLVHSLYNLLLKYLKKRCFGRYIAADKSGSMQEIDRIQILNNRYNYDNARQAWASEYARRAVKKSVPKIYISTKEYVVKIWNRNLLFENHSSFMSNVYYLKF
jgi:hypothetical protein